MEEKHTASFPRCEKVKKKNGMKRNPIYRTLEMNRQIKLIMWGKKKSHVKETKPCENEQMKIHALCEKYDIWTLKSRQLYLKRTGRQIQTSVRKSKQVCQRSGRANT